MKRTLMLAAAVSLAFVACQKQQEAPAEETTPAVETTPAPAPAAAPMAPMDTMQHDTTNMMTPATTTGE